MRIRTPVLILTCGLLLSACGHKAAPMPLLKPLPKAVENLSVRQLGAAMRVSWQAPKTNQDGTPITDLDHFAVYRMSYDPADDCLECRDTSTLLRDVDPDFPGDVQVVDGRYFLIDRQDLLAGRGYQYRVSAVTNGGYPGVPAKIRRPYLQPPTAPKELSATSLERFIRLKWQPVQPVEGMTLLGYHLYRATGSAPLALSPLNATPELETGYDDFTITVGSSYRYAVRAVWKRDDTELESELSNLVTVPADGLQ
ncbi:hypothetical protein B5V00_12830 [Geothermobacter hydrogeniphilus]|uniref:Fibronectin type-III domain-containing protein n=2 Tax=Geothermobacter hydrogeniphilus TaxID=1969733 RepID=A0A1X0XXI8_9BACT|nr:hypothetical protein B5V00_12830 [Geothermobacter hydrogeniphilus]